MTRKIDFANTFGNVPESFSHRVQYALRQTAQQNAPVKRLTLRTVIIAVLLLTLVTAALAVALSGTADIFGFFYGERFIREMEQGQVSPGGQTITLNGVAYTMNDTVVIPAQTQWTGLPEDKPADFQQESTFHFYVTGTIAAAHDGVVIMAWDEYTVNDPVGDALYYGNTYSAGPEDALTYAQLAREKGLDRVRMVTCMPNGILDTSGELIPCDAGYTVIPQLDGTVQFSGEIPLNIALPRQTSYQLSLSIITQDVDLDGNPIADSRQTSEWLIPVVPQ